MHCIRRLVRKLLILLILVDIQDKGMPSRRFTLALGLKEIVPMGSGSLNP